MIVWLQSGATLIREVSQFIVLGFHRGETKHMETSSDDTPAQPPQEAVRPVSFDTLFIVFVVL